MLHPVPVRYAHEFDDFELDPVCIPFDFFDVGQTVFGLVCAWRAGVCAWRAGTYCLEFCFDSRISCADKI